MKLLALIAAVALICAQAQTPAKLVAGEVTAIDAAAKQFKVKGDDGVSYTVAFQDNAIYLRMPFGETDQKKAARIAFSDIRVGDRLIARGPFSEDSKTVTVRTVITMTKTDVAQKQAHDQADWQRRGLTGIVTAVNPASKEIIMTTRGRDSKAVTVDVSGASFRRYSQDSVRFADAKPSSLAEVQTGDTLRVLGDRAEDGTRVKAEEIVSGAFETIAGTVISADAATGEVRITNLQTKKPVVVKTNSGTMLRRIDEQTATMLARRMRPQAVAADAPGGASIPSAPPGGRGFGGGRGPGASGDLQQVLDRSPQLSLADLKKGDAVIVSEAKAPEGAPVTAFSFVAGVEPFLAAAPRTAGEVNLGSWNLEVSGGAPEQ
ncbi:MAG TPA: hypothetical protein VKX49_19170 [Bryobacteraceae bacterium]|nr:hypothetical protein [Bryobacteraceae bacterium]